MSWINWLVDWFYVLLIPFCFGFILGEDEGFEKGLLEGFKEGFEIGKTGKGDTTNKANPQQTPTTRLTQELVKCNNANRKRKIE